MKTFCKKVDITNLGLIKQSIYQCLNEKWRRNDVIRLLSEKSGQDTKEIRKIIAQDRQYELDNIIGDIAMEMRHSIVTRNITLPPIVYSTRYDRNSNKERLIGTQSIIHQCYEHLAVNGAKELFDKKIGVYQCASIPGRGQSYGKRAIEKWLKDDVPGTKYALQMDVKKCYPSVDQEKLKELLHRDIRKNPDLLYLLDTLIGMFDTGLSIGSYLSQWLCNYYLSYAYHFISERLFTTRKPKNGNPYNVRMISYVIFYMDDIIVFGSNKKYLMKAFHEIDDYFKNFLKLTIKDNWRLFRVYYIDRNGNSHGSFVDMMGFRFYRGKTTIRRTIFKNAKRKFDKLRKTVRSDKKVSKQLAQSTMSYWGWVKHTNSYKFKNEHDVVNMVNIAKKTVSRCDRKENERKKKINETSTEQNKDD